MQSGGARTATAVVVMTLVFAPVAKKNHWLYKLVGKSQKTENVQCAPGDACPATETVVERVYLPKPKTKPRTEQVLVVQRGAKKPPVAVKGKPKAKPKLRTGRK